MAKISKTKRPHKHCERYLNEQKRIKNKSRKLEKKLRIITKEREKEPNKINPNTKLSPKRRPIENIIESSRIGRQKEGFQREGFKFKKGRPILKNE